VVKHPYKNPEWITLQECARILNVSPQTVAKYAKQMGIRGRPFCDGARRFVWNRADAEAAWARMMAEAAPDPEPAQPAQPELPFSPE
jgi:hypothetical protein